MVNLFWLSPPRYLRGRLNYSRCARQHIDAHVVKIPLEAAQLLYSAHHALAAADDWRSRAPMAKTGERGYRPTHMNNPISKWVRESAAHYRHAAAYGLALCDEYRHRYGREHACEAHLQWLQTNEPSIPDTTATAQGAGSAARFKIARAPPCAMPDEFKAVAPPESSGTEGKEGSAGEAESEANGHDERPEQIVVTAAEGKAAATSSVPMMVRKTTAKLESKVETTTGEAMVVEQEETKEVKVKVTSEEAVNDESEEEGERAEAGLEPIEGEVAAASEVAFPLHVYQSYRAYYLGQKLSLKMSTFKTRKVPHWAQERLKEVQSIPKPAPVKKGTKTASSSPTTTTGTRTRRRASEVTSARSTTMTTAVKRKRRKAADDDDEAEDDPKDDDYTEGTGTATRSRPRPSRKQRKQEEEQQAGRGD